MDRKLNQFILVIVMILLAMPLCLSDDMSITIEEPKATTYYTTINLPLNYSIANADACSYSINSSVSNTTIGCGNDKLTNFRVDTDGNYTLTVFAENASGIITGTVDFTANRETSTGKSIIVSAILLFTLGLAFFFAYLSIELEQEHTPLKIFLLILSFIVVLYDMFLIHLTMDEYVKNTALISMNATFFQLMTWLLWGLFAYLFVLILVGIFSWWEWNKEKKRTNGFI